jgi:hypothetical protein
MVATLIYGTIIGGAWLYNIYFWFKGFVAVFAKLKEPLSIRMLSSAVFLLLITMGDIASVGLCRHLIGEYATSILPASIIAVFISWYVNRIRLGKSELINDLRRKDPK